MSDDDYVRDFGSRADVQQSNHLNRQAWVDYNNEVWDGDFIARLQVQKYQTLQNNQRTVDVPYQIMPRLSATYLKDFDPYHATLNVFGQFTNFEHQTKQAGQRAVLYPSVSFDFSRPWGYVRPKVGVHATHYNLEDDATSHDGSISRDAIASAVLERVNQIASRRNLDFIGPDRGNVIPMEISLAGLAGEALSDAGESSDFLSEYVDQLLAGDADDIAHVSHALLERYMELLREDEDGLLLSSLHDRFENDIRTLVLEKDIRPAVEDAVGQLQCTLDEES